MILMILVTLLLSIFLVGPAMLFVGANLLKIEGISFKRTIITNIAIMGAGVLLLLVQLGLVLLGVEYKLLKILVLLAALLASIWIIKILFKTTILRALGAYLFSLVLTSLFYSLVWTVGFRAYSIAANSMAPTLIKGDHVYVNKIVYRINEPERGDLIVFLGKKTNNDMVKRLIGLPGEEIEIREGKVYINKAVMKEILVVKTTSEDGDTAPWENYGPVKIPEKSFFVLGDNTRHSYDSRHFGFVSRSAVKGRVDTIYWSMDMETKHIRWKRILRTL